jgi:hypothetical protein
MADSLADSYVSGSSSHLYPFCDPHSTPSPSPHRQNCYTDFEVGQVHKVIDERGIVVTEEGRKEVKSKVPELLDGQRSILEGKIVKKRRIIKKERWLVLTDKPRLFYVKLKNNTIKGEIPLTNETKVVILKGSKWNVEVPKRVYELRSKGEIHPNQWAEAINGILGKDEWHDMD